MAIAAGVSSKGFTGSGTSQATTGVTTQASGSCFVVGMTFEASQTFSSLVDSKGNTYTQIGTELLWTGSFCKSRLYYCENGIGGATHTATVTTGGASAITVHFLEITGGATTGILDQSARREDTATPFTLAAALTTTQAAEMLVSFFADDSGNNPVTYAETGLGSSSVPAGSLQSNGSAGFPGAFAISIKSSTGSFNPSWTATGAGACGVWLATFKEAGGGSSIAAISSGYALRGMR
jgi:hypothetical protein